MRSATAILGAIFVAFSCYSVGAVLFKFLRISSFLRRQETYPLAFLLGASVLHLWMFLLLALQIAYWPLILLPLAASLLPKSTFGQFPPLNINLRWVAGLPAAAFFAIYFIFALAPEHSPDGSEYHLGVLARELRHHGFEKITTNMYAMLSQGVELVFAPAFLLGKHSAAALTHLVFAIALAFAIFNFGRRMDKPWAGAAAALLTFVSPVVGLDAATAYVDVGAAAIAFAAFYWLEIWDQERDWHLLIPAGLMAGYAFAAKLTLFTIGLYAVGFVLLRARKMKPVLLTAACTVLMAGPWIVRNSILYENPTAPLGTAIFRNPYTHVLFEEQYRERYRRLDIENLWTLPLEVTVHGYKTAGLIGPAFLLLPIGLLSLRSRVGRHVWAAALIVTSTYFANISTRFLIPSLPFFSLSIAMGIGEMPMLLSVLMLAHALLSWPPFILWYSHRDAGRLTGLSLRAAVGIEKEDTFLNRVLPTYPVARMIDQLVPPGEAVFSKNGVAEAYTEHELRQSYKSASNEVVDDTFNVGADESREPLRILSFRFRARTARRFRVEQIAEANKYDVWSVHEVRFFRNGVEVAEHPEWRTDAWPVPWEVEFAFDRDPATRWRSWETAKPGMYIAVDFGREETIDEIRIETSTESSSARLQPEVMNASGTWESLNAQRETREISPSPDARKLATSAMSKLGVHYVVLYSSDHLADDVGRDPANWGMQEIGRAGDARLYKIVP
jgi:hypothetical protein